VISQVTGLAQHVRQVGSNVFAVRVARFYQFYLQLTVSGVANGVPCSGRHLLRGNSTFVFWRVRVIFSERCTIIGTDSVLARVRLAGFKALPVL